MAKKPPTPKWDFRDVSSGIQKLREILLGRKYVFHKRFAPLISPRSIPPPDIPRGPEYKYANQWYGVRNALNSVKPPVVAPVAEGRPPPKASPKKYPCAAADGASDSQDSISFDCPPTPGMPWWFDGHCYYEYAQDVCPPPSTGPPPATCATPEPAPPPCQPCEIKTPPVATSSPGICDPCNPPKPDKPKKT